MRSVERSSPALDAIGSWKRGKVWEASLGGSKGGLAAGGKSAIETGSKTGSKANQLSNGQ
jgi:hypothetical protein